jgi:hypothetical protein
VWLAEISDKTSLPELFFPSVILALLIVTIGRKTWTGRIASLCLVTLWELATGLELCDRSFVEVASKEFGPWYEATLIAGGAIPLAATVYLALQAWRAGALSAPAPRKCG